MSVHVKIEKIGLVPRMTLVGQYDRVNVNVHAIQYPPMTLPEVPLSALSGLPVTPQVLHHYVMVTSLP